MNEYDKKFIECYNKYRTPLTRYIYKQIGDLDSSQEIVQDLFAYLFERKIQLDINCPTLQSFVYRIARNRAIDYLKKTIKRAAPISNAENLIIDNSTIAQVEDICCEGEVLGTMRSLITDSPETSREVIVRKIYSGHRTGRISRDLSISEYRINKILHEFTMRVREKLSEYYTDH